MKTIEQVHEEIQTALKAARETHEYRAEGASIEFTNAMVARMRQLDVSRSKLAARIGVNPAYISKILHGDTNFSLETMVKIANALESEFRCQLQPVRAGARQFDGHRSSRRKSASDPRMARNGNRASRQRHKQTRQRLKAAAH